MIGTLAMTSLHNATQVIRMNKENVCEANLVLELSFTIKWNKMVWYVYIKENKEIYRGKKIRMKYKK